MKDRSEVGVSTAHQPVHLPCRRQRQIAIVDSKAVDISRVDLLCVD